MRAYIIVMEEVASLLLIALAGWLARAAWRGPRGAFRVASAGVAAVCILLGATSFQHVLHVATRDDLAPSGWGDMLLGPFAAARATIAVLVTALAAMLGLRYWTRLGRAQSMVDVLIDGLPSEGHLRLARLSARELEVVGLIRKGVLSDGDIAKALHISPATAGTHVQNILKKAELHNRRDLMLLATLEQPFGQANG